MYRSVIAPATERHPRNTEADIAVLPDGRLLLAYTRFEGGSSDFDRAEVVGRYSSDRGRTWSEDLVLQPNDADVNCMSPSLLQLPEGELLLFYLRKNSPTDLQVYVKRSADQGQTWGEPTRVTDGQGYYVMCNARAVRLSSGRLLAPVSHCQDARGPIEGAGHHVVLCFVSNDDGLSWHCHGNAVDLPRRGAMEPGVVELADGSLLMVLRSQLGRLYFSRSSDGGEAWAPPEMSALVAPEAPSAIARLPQSEDLLLVWNDNYDPGVDHGGIRSPLRSAISRDGGQKWYRYRTIEGDPSRAYSYPSLTFVDDEVLLTYYERERPGRLSLVFRALPVEWFYRIQDKFVLQGLGRLPDYPAESIGSPLGRVRLDGREQLEPQRES
ncbi:MAG: exo-alpha-sialidase [Anaerolineae bacterium]|nr:exo-alpha-sialidase [Anaerolineae bacterium]